MCELFAISSSSPVNITFSLEEFSRHGGLTAPHKDGWGIAFYANKDIQRIREVDSASNSDCLSFIKNHPFYSKMVISHIRRATQGQLTLENTQPFSRELGGRMHVFAHNGDLTGISENEYFKQIEFKAIGETDSEFAFCGLMNSLKDLWTSIESPSLQDRLSTVSRFAKLIKGFGPANFIYSDSDYLYAHGHKRWDENEQDFHPPGLHYLSRNCIAEKTSREEINGVDIQTSEIDQEVALLASVPLTDEPWQPLKEGEVIAISNGRIFNAGKKI